MADPVEFDGFLDRLHQSGLFSQSQLGELTARFPPGTPTHVVSNSLVEKGWLTRYQVEKIWGNESSKLTLGPYHILEELGKGGFGCVYKARHTIMDRIVALKVISPQFIEDTRARTWFRREVLAITKLQHPNIVLAYDANEIDDVLFLAMEYVEGNNLEQMVRKGGPLSIGLTSAILHQAGKALQYAHETGLVHRDIKPANLLIPRDGISSIGQEGSTFLTGPPLVKVVDFGLARLHAQSKSQTLVSTRGFVGTPDYVSPEQARNVHEVDIRSDLYSLGCTFYFALTGRPPFTAESPLEIVVKHLEKEPEPIEQFRPEVPPVLASIVRRLMAKKPEHRFQTPAELVGELNFLYGRGTGSRPLIVLPPSPPPAPVGPISSPPLKNSKKISNPVLFRPVEKTSAGAKEMTLLPGPGEASTPEKELAHTRVLPESAMSHTPPAPGIATHVEEQANPSAEDLTVSDIEIEPFQIEKNLSILCLEWLEIIGNLTRGSPPGMDEGGYRLLHRKLLEAYRQHQKKAPAPIRRTLAQLESLVEPWISLHSLVEAGSETLANLHQDTGRLQQHLGIARRVGIGKFFWAAAILLLAGLVGIFLFQKPAAWNMDPASWHGLWPFLESHPLLTMAIGLPLVVGGAVFFLARVFR